MLPEVASSLPPPTVASNSRSSASRIDRFRSAVCAASGESSARRTSVSTLILPADLTTRVSALTRVLLLKTPPTTPGETEITPPEAPGAVGTASLATSKSIERSSERVTPRLLMAVTVITLVPAPAAAKSSALRV